MRNWRKVAAIVLALALVVSMAACGGDTPSSSTAPAESKTESKVSTPAEESSTPAEESSEASEPAEEDEGEDLMATATTPP